MQTYKLETNDYSKFKIVLIIVMVASVIMIGLFSYLFYLHLKSQPLIEYPRYTLSTNEWTNGNVIITVNNEGNKIESYSFDGGKNYQESNKYEVLTNGDFFIVVKDINGKISKSTPVSIKNIDKEGPVISFEKTTTVQIGSRFSLKNGVTVTDSDGSGLNSSYVVVPENIDTTKPGNYVVTYTAFDKAGNYTEQTRKIIVEDIKGNVYYRYRTFKMESYQCDKYMCNCVTSDSIESTKSCPSGYSFEEPNKCCQSCYKTCQKKVYSKWSKWSLEKVTPTANREVETKIQ